MQLTYVGAIDAVELELPNGGWSEFERGKKYDFDAELAESLLEQEANWEPADAAAKKLAEKVRARLAEPAEGDAPAVPAGDAADAPPAADQEEA